MVGPHPTSSATWVASRPRLIDLSCGFQSARPSGTRSSSLRVVAISWSNSGNKVWLNFIGILLSRLVEKVCLHGCRAGSAVIDQPPPPVLDPGVRIDLVRLGAPRAQDMPNLDPPRHQSVGNQPAVAAPGHGLGTEDDGPALPGE